MHAQWITTWIVIIASGTKNTNVDDFKQINTYFDKVCSDYGQFRLCSRQPECLDDEVSCCQGWVENQVVCYRAGTGERQHMAILDNIPMCYTWYTHKATNKDYIKILKNNISPDLPDLHWKKF